MEYKKAVAKKGTIVETNGIRKRESGGLVRNEEGRVVKKIKGKRCRKVVESQEVEAKEETRMWR